MATENFDNFINAAIYYYNTLRCAMEVPGVPRNKQSNYPTRQQTANAKRAFIEAGAKMEDKSCSNNS